MLIPFVCKLLYDLKRIRNRYERSSSLTSGKEVKEDEKVFEQEGNKT
jgi:hypothetical protein